MRLLKQLGEVAYLMGNHTSAEKLFAEVKFANFTQYNISTNLRKECSTLVEHEDHVVLPGPTDGDIM